jgi:hypothetical protein
VVFTTGVNFRQDVGVVGILIVFKCDVSVTIRVEGEVAVYTVVRVGVGVVVYVVPFTS